VMPSGMPWAPGATECFRAPSVDPRVRRTEPRPLAAEQGGEFAPDHPQQE